MTAWPSSARSRRPPLIFDDCAHAPLYEKVEEFNQRTLTFLMAHSVHELAATRT